MANSELENVQTMTDLGVVVNSKLGWNDHIEGIIKKANSTMWVTIRNMGFKSPFKAKKAVYMAMVRSKVEYNSVLWNPHSKEEMYNLERIQRRATNFITNNPRRPSPDHIDYKERLLRCNLLPLTYRREVLDITFFLKSYHGLTGFAIRNYLQYSDEIVTLATRQQVQGCHLQTKNMKISSNYKNQSYPSRVCRIWNALPMDLQKTLRPLNESLVIKQFLNPFYYHLRDNHFDPENTCTWISFCRCQRCRTC